MAEIFMPQTMSAMRAWRQKARDCYGDRYDNFVAPFRSIIVMYCRRNNGKDPVLAAKDMLGMLRGKWRATKNEEIPKDRNLHWQACLYSAAIDVIEMKLIENAPKPTERNIVTPDDPEFDEELDRLR